MFDFLKRKSKPSQDRNKDITSLAAWESRKATAPNPEPVTEVKTPDAVEAPSFKPELTERKPREPRTPREPGAPRAKRERLNKEQVLEGLKAWPELLKASRIVGAWIWIDDEAFQATPEAVKALHDLGFRHNPARAAWQNTCGKWFRKTDKPKAAIYAKYGLVSAAEYLGVETA